MTYPQQAVRATPDPVLRHQVPGEQGEENQMAELTVLEEKLAEVLGLAQAAKAATDKVSSLTDEPDLSTTLQRMHDEADETESRCTEVAGDIDGKKTAILDKARETKAEAAEMMRTYLGEDADALDGFEFLTMAEAGEVGHWSVLRKLNERARRDDVQQLVEWALPIQERHFQAVLDGSLELAGQEDPDEPS
jgi:energy-converting hydrogenase A subunit M